MHILRLVLVGLAVAFLAINTSVTSEMGWGSERVSAAEPVLQSSGFELGGQIMTFLYPSEMRSAGMAWLKMQVVWNRGGSTADAQNIINHARRHGFKVLLSIKGNRNEVAVNQQQYFRDYANFVAAVARLSPDAIEIWNEPNIDREWPAGLIHGSIYTQLLAQAYPAIKAANPNVLVISGAPAPTGYFGGGCTASGCDDKPFIEQMAAAGAAQYFDCTGVHYNEGVLPPTATSGDPRGNSGHYSRYYPTMVSTYRGVFPNKPLCFTELGYLTPEGLGSLPAGFEWGANTSRQEQADWLAQAAALSRDSGVVRLMVVWNVDASSFGSDPMAGWAIIRNNSCLACETLGRTMGVGQPTPTPSGPDVPVPGLTAEYFDNADFTNHKLTRIDPTVNFNWGQNIPTSGVGADTFSVRWTGQVVPQFSETYTFYTTSDDGVRLWVNGQQLINNWTDHAPFENSRTIALNAGQRYDIRLDYYENALGAQIELRWSSPSQPKEIIPQSRLWSAAGAVTATPPPQPGTGTGLTGSYFDTHTFTDLRLNRVDPVVNFDWGHGSPAAQIAPDTFSVRWAGQVQPLHSETYTFYTVSDDGVRLWVNGRLIIDNWHDYPPTENRGTISLVAGQRYDIRFDYYDNALGASVRLEWSSPSQTRQVVPQSQLYPAAAAPPTASATPTTTHTLTPTQTATSTLTLTMTPTQTATSTASTTPTQTATATPSVTPQPTQTATSTPTPSTTPTVAPSATPVAGAGTGLTGEYFDNTDFTSLRLTRVDPVINFDWGHGSPHTSIATETFSVRWTGQVVPLYSETYTFHTVSDDGVRLWVNGQLLINNWNVYPPTENRGTIALTAGQPYAIRLEYFDNTLGAVAQLYWSSPRQQRQIIPQSQLIAGSVTPTPPPPTATTVPVGSGTGLTGSYYDNIDFTGLRVTRVDPRVDFNWARSAPAAGVDAETFAVRWLGQVEAVTSGTYTFYTYSDDGVRLWVNGRLIIDDWTNHSAIERSGSISLTGGQRYDIRLEYYDNTLEAVVRLSWSGAGQPKQVIPQSQLYPQAAAPVTATPQPSGNGLLGQYFDNRDLTAPLVTRTDGSINFDWGHGSPAPAIGSDTFSVRWTGQIVPPASGSYTFYTVSDDGLRLWVNGQLLINNWTIHPPTENQGTVTLQAGQPVDLRLEFFEEGSGAVIRLLWSGPQLAKQVIAGEYLRPAAQQSAALMSLALQDSSPTASPELEMLPLSETPTLMDTRLLTLETGTPPPATSGNLSDPATPTPSQPEAVSPVLEAIPTQEAATLTPTPTATLLPGETVVSASLCEAAADQAGALIVGQRLSVGVENGVAWTTGLRFCGLAVPAGARVISAWAELTAADGSNQSVELSVAFDASPNSASFTAGAAPTFRPMTGAQSWTPSQWQAGLRYRTPDLAGSLAQVTGDVNWQPGGSITFLISGRTGVAVREILSGTGDAQLYVSYIAGPPVLPSVTPTEITPTALPSETPVQLSATADVPTSVSPSETPLPVEPTLEMTIAPTPTPTLEPLVPSETPHDSGTEPDSVEVTPAVGT